MYENSLLHDQAGLPLVCKEGQCSQTDHCHPSPPQAEGGHCHPDRCERGLWQSPAPRPGRPAMRGQGLPAAREPQWTRSDGDAWRFPTRSGPSHRGRGLVSTPGGRVDPGTTTRAVAWQSRGTAPTHRAGLASHGSTVSSAGPPTAPPPPRRPYLPESGGSPPHRPRKGQVQHPRPSGRVQQWLQDPGLWAGLTDGLIPTAPRPSAWGPGPRSLCSMEVEARCPGVRAPCPALPEPPGAPRGQPPSTPAPRPCAQQTTPRRHMPPWTHAGVAPRGNGQ